MTWVLPWYLRIVFTLLVIQLNLSESNGPKLGITQQPINGIVNSKNYKISCKAFGTPTPSNFTWYKDDVILPLKSNSVQSHIKDGEGTLEISDTLASRDEGNYRCLVKNSFGAIFSRLAKMQFPYINKFSKRDITVTARKGDKVLLLCEAPDSYPDRHIYWEKLQTYPRRSFVPLTTGPNSRYSINSEGNLYFSYTTNDDFADYTCRVENQVVKRTKERRFKLKFTTGASELDSRPGVWHFSDKVVMKGSTFVMECIAHGRPVPEMEFYNVATESVLENSLQEGNRLRHHFPSFNAENHGTYTCRVKNQAGQSHSKTSLMKMEAAPEMLSTGGKKSSDKGSSINFPCVATGEPPARYSWYFNGKLLNHGHNYVYIYKGNLTLNTVDDYHQGIYQCFAKNRHGEAIMTISFTIIEIPAHFGDWSIKPVVQTTELVGNNVEIHCVPTGVPKPSVMWSRKKDDKFIDILEMRDSRFTVRTGTLRIKNLELEDQGKYRCTAKNRLATVTWDSLLKVNEKVAITEPLSKETVFQVNRTITLTCKVNHSPDVETSIKWKYWENEIKPGEKQRIISTIDGNSVLSIYTPSTSRTGIYTCVVDGGGNSYEESLLVTVQGQNGHQPPDLPRRNDHEEKPPTNGIRGPPDPPRIVEAKHKDANNVEVSWLQGRNNGNKAIKIHIQARLKDSQNNWYTVKISNKTKVSDNEIIQLSPWTKYMIRVACENNIGLSKSTESDGFVEIPRAKPSKSPENILGRGTGPAEITISFDLLPRIDQNAEGIAYFVYYRARHSSYNMIKRPVPDKQNYIKIHLTTPNVYYSPYEFQVQAKNDMGHGPRSQVQICYTGERTPLRAPTGLEVIASVYGTRNVHAVWGEVNKTRNLMRGKFLAYRIFYWEKTDDDGLARDERYNNTVINSIALKLRPATEYFFKVACYNSAGLGPRTMDYGPIKTPESVPSQPANFNVMLVTSELVSLTWNSPLSENGIIIEYQFTYFVLPDGRPTIFTTLKDKLKVELLDLDMSAEYQFEVAAVNSAGTGKKATINYDLSKVPAVKIKGMKVVDTSTVSIILSWPPVNDSYITCYKLEYWADDSKHQTIASCRENRFVYWVQNLQPSTRYNFQVAIKNKYGLGPKSEILSTSTEDRTSSSTSKPSVMLDRRSNARRLENNSWLLLTLLTVIIALAPR